MATAPRRQFIVYDERAHMGADVDECAVLVCEDKYRDAHRFPARGYIYAYDVENGNQLVNETFIGPTRMLERS